MAVVVWTDRPSDLLAAIRREIDARRVQTWEYDSDGDFIHTPEQWRRRAWLRPKVSTDRITFIIFPPKNIVLSREIYAVYHGRFVEMLLVHFDTDFSSANATSMPSFGDLVKWS